MNSRHHNVTQNLKTYSTTEYLHEKVARTMLHVLYLCLNKKHWAKFPLNLQVKFTTKYISTTICTKNLQRRLFFGNRGSQSNERVKSYIFYNYFSYHKICNIVFDDDKYLQTKTYIQINMCVRSCVYVYLWLSIALKST